MRWQGRTDIDPYAEDLERLPGSKAPDRGASISTADPHFAEASVDDTGCTFTLGYVPRRTVAAGASSRSSSTTRSPATRYANVPESVIREFGLKGQLNRYGGGIGIC